jgi:hypothetical protein
MSLFTSPDPPSQLLFNGYRGSFPGVKRSGRPSCSAEFKSEWSYTSTPSRREQDNYFFTTRKNLGFQPAPVCPHGKLARPHTDNLNTSRLYCPTLPVKGWVENNNACYSGSQPCQWACVFADLYFAIWRMHGVAPENKNTSLWPFNEEEH